MWQGLWNPRPIFQEWEIWIYVYGTSILDFNSLNNGLEAAAMILGNTACSDIGKE